jgi:hypothetical protein
MNKVTITINAAEKTKIVPIKYPQNTIVEFTLDIRLRVR